MTEIRIAAPTDTAAWTQVVNRTRAGVVPSGYTWSGWFGVPADNMATNWTPTSTGIQRAFDDFYGFLALSNLYQPTDSDRGTVVTVNMTATGTSSGAGDYLVTRYRLGGSVKTATDTPMWITEGSNKTLTQVFVIPAGATDISVSTDASAIDVGDRITALSVTAVVQYMPAPNATTFRIWRPATGLTDVTSKMLGSFILNAAQSGDLEIELKYTYDLTTWVGNPSRAGRLLVINPSRFTRVHAKPSGSFGFPGAYYQVWHRWNSGSNVADVDLDIPGSTTATGSYNSKVKIPPLLIDVPAGQSSSTLTISVALNGGVAGPQQPTLFVPC
ncbi:hypothetical protein [Micropruina sp.]|uniref:hypothetical protein n=1 Tax=Micropruina sp. TaxID=2737536 RepID=UPI0039E2BDDE